jgi:hypothetical protein
MPHAVRGIAHVFALLAVNKTTFRTTLDGKTTMEGSSAGSPMTTAGKGPAGEN